MKLIFPFKALTGDVVIACIDTFFSTVNKPTVIVVDQSSIHARVGGGIIPPPISHTSAAILNKIEEWFERGITIFELPPYSPQLNLIEILWRFIKYQWIEIDAYKNWKTFVASIEKVLKEVGKNYVINFV